MRSWVLVLVLAACVLAAPIYAGGKSDQSSEQERIRASADVFREVMNVPEKGIPRDLMEDAHCVIIIPGMIKGGFIVGGKYGKGVATCRDNGNWSAPAMVMIAGGSFGAQIGGEAVDLVMLVMNKGGENFLYRDKVTLGADVSAAAGPVGRMAAAETNASLKSQILVWSRSRGLFAGVALNGATLRPDKESNRDLYGRDVTTREILSGNVPKPAAAEPLISALQQHSRGEGEHVGR